MHLLHACHAAACASSCARPAAHARTLRACVKAGISAQDIDILVTTSSVFAPTPSVSSMLINMFKFREDIQAYSLAGMGCGNGVIGVHLVRDILQAHPGANALFVCAEICSSAFYTGRDKHCLISNALFRMGGAAAILTSGASQRSRCKYQLTHAERVHTGARDTGYKCVRCASASVSVWCLWVGKIWLIMVLAGEN